MIREVSLEEISDGKLYSANDMVKADCNGCKDCFACCKGMGSSIILDPMDIYRLTAGLNVTFEVLMQENIELQMVDGLILPNIKMAGAEEKCSFLNDEGRCSIHHFRPGICRLFPLGRYYEGDGFKYFLQTGECSNKSRTKVKVRKWIDTPELKKYEQFIINWHLLLKGQRDSLNQTDDLQFRKQISMALLDFFFVRKYDKEQGFYEQFEERKGLFNDRIRQFI